MRRNRRDRDDRRLDRRLWPVVIAIGGVVLIYAICILVFRVIPYRGGELEYGENPALFLAISAAFFGLIAATLLSRIRLPKAEGERLSRHVTLPLDSAVRTSYERNVISERSLIIAVDGPAASGKGTVAARLARHYALPYLDTGLLYRAVGLAVIDAGGSVDDAAAAEAVARGIDAAHLEDVERLTDRGAGEAASRVAGHPGVRAALLDYQRAFAAQEGGAVLDGRDIGTVIAPDAPAKLFVTATPEVRAMRRWKQLTGRGEVIAYEDMLADILRRDERDAGRGAAPMVQAHDAVLLDTTEMDIDAAFDAARRIVEAARVRKD